MKTIHIEQASHHQTDPYHELALSVVRQAAEDYRMLARKLHGNISREEKEQIAKELESITRFFLSDWYFALTGAENGRSVLRHLSREVFDGD